MMKMRRRKRNTMKRRMRMRLHTTRSKTRITNTQTMMIAAGDSNNRELAGKTQVKSHQINLLRILCRLLMQTKRNRRISI